MTPDEQARLQKQITDDLRNANEKLESFIKEVSTLTIVLEERVKNNKERFQSLEREIDDLCDIVDRIRSSGQQRVTTLEERYSIISLEIKDIKSSIKELSVLREDSAVTKTKLSSVDKAIAVFVGLLVSIISVVLSIIVNHVLSGG